MIMGYKKKAVQLEEALVKNAENTKVEVSVIAKEINKLSKEIPELKDYDLFDLLQSVGNLQRSDKLVKVKLNEIHGREWNHEL
jgi:hypothetical protein